MCRMTSPGRCVVQLSWRGCGEDTLLRRSRSLETTRRQLPPPVSCGRRPKVETLEEALQLVADSVAAGGRGAVIGRNVWGFKDIVGAVRAFKSVVHDRLTPKEAMKSRRHEIRSRVLSHVPTAQPPHLPLPAFTTRSRIGSGRGRDVRETARRLDSSFICRAAATPHRRRAGGRRRAVGPSLPVPCRPRRGRSRGPPKPEARLLCSALLLCPLCSLGGNSGSEEGIAQKKRKSHKKIRCNSAAQTGPPSPLLFMFCACFRGQSRIEFPVSRLSSPDTPRAPGRGQHSPTARSTTPAQLPSGIVA